MKKKLLILFICLISLGFKSDDYKFSSLNGDLITYKELITESRNTVLFLWTTWCGSCRNSLKTRNINDNQNKNIKFYYINLGESKRTIEKLSKRMNLKQSINDDIILDIKSALARKFRVMFVPTFIFFKDGEVVYQSNSISDRLLVELYGDEKIIKR